VIGELRVVDDPGAIDIRTPERAILVNHHLDHDGQPVLILVQRREIGGEDQGEHREDLGRRVDGRGVVLGVGIGGGPLAHQRVDVCDRHQDLHHLPAEWLCDRKLIEVAGVVIVDRAPGQVSQISDGWGRLGRRTCESADLSQDRR